MKNHKIIIGLIIVVASVASYCFCRQFFKEAKYVYLAQKTGIKEIPQDSQTEALENKLEVYFTRVGLELGTDPAGRLAAVIFLRQVAPNVVQRDASLRGVCEKQKTCPLALATVYKTALERLDAASDFVAKELIQEQLVHSDVPRKVKIELLARNVMGTRLQRAAGSSTVTGSSNILLTPQAHYLMTTSGQLLKLRTADSQYLQTMVISLARSKDIVAKKLFMTNLAKSYPRYNQYLLSQAKSMGIQLASAN